MNPLPPCPACSSVYTYENLDMLMCPECGHEWHPLAGDIDAHHKDEGKSAVVTDANGNALADGDTVTVVKDLKIKGSSQILKVGTKVRNIRLVDGDHDIDCKIDGLGAMKLKSCFVKKG